MKSNDIINNDTLHLMQDKREELVLVSLNTKFSHEKYPLWLARSAEEKINILKKHIIDICEILNKQAKDKMCMITAKEYIVASCRLQRAVSSKIKKAYIETMREISIKYPNIILAPGTLSTFKKVKYSEEIFNKKYKLLEDFIEVFPEYPVSHEKEPYDAIKNNSNKPKEIVFLRNTLFIFNKGNVESIDKKLPFHEDKFNQGNSFSNEDIDSETLFSSNFNVNQRPHILFQFAKSESKTKNKIPNSIPCRYFKSPFTEKKRLFAFSICRDNMVEIDEPFSGKDTIKVNIIARFVNLNIDKPFFHIILSDYLDLNISSFVGSFILHVDSKNTNQLIEYSKQDNNDCDVRFFDYDFFHHWYSNTVIEKIDFRPPTSKKDIIIQKEEETSRKSCRIF